MSTEVDLKQRETCKTGARAKFAFQLPSQGDRASSIVLQWLPDSAYDDAARATIASGAAEVAGEDAEAKASYAKKRRDADDRDRHIKGDVD